MALELWALKLIAIVSLVVVQVFFSLAPRLAQRWFVHSTTWQVIMSLLNSFSGGLMFGTSLVHLLAEGVENAELAELSVFLPFCVMGLSFLAAWVVFGILLPRVLGHHHGHGHGHGHGKQKKTKGKKKKKRKPQSSGEVTGDDEVGIVSPTLDGEEEGEGRMTTSSSNISLPDTNNNDLLDASPSSTPIIISEDDHDKLIHHHQHEGSHRHRATDTDSNMVAAAYVFTGALFFHNVFSGMVLGLGVQNGPVLSIFFALFAHKWAESLALGILLAQASGLSTRVFVILASCPAIGTITGAVIGVIIITFATSSLRGQYLVLFATSAISSGLFAFIALVDILTPEFQSPDDSAKRLSVKFVCCLLGFGLATLLSALLSDH